MAVLAFVVLCTFLFSPSSTHPLSLQKNVGAGGPGGLNPTVLNVVCPDGKQECSDGNTCCKTGSVSYGCCPMLKAVCCPDMKHCCPENYKCESANCQKGLDSHPLLQLLGCPVEEPPPLQNQVCPDKTAECPDNETCCKINDSNYGCCPQANAMCCSDMKHCCPDGFVCDGDKCTKGASTRQLQLISHPGPTNPPLQNIICPDKKSECPDGNTCCLDGSSYGCCPKPNAVCCSDQKHCCPEDYACEGDRCVDKKLYHMFVPLVTPLLKKSQTVVCPNSKYTCSDEETCCARPNNEYGCCPLKKANCCSDMVHCCPEEYTCESGKCVLGSLQHPLLQLVNRPVRAPLPTTPEGVVCPDHNMLCPNGDTCCKMEEGGYGCCPQSHGVCCGDMKHCCANGYTCATDKCEKNKSSLPLLLLEIETAPDKIVCPDGESECADGDTCCMTSSGSYGCCPEAKAVCCSDMLHCCPEGYGCVSGDKCEKTGSPDHPLLNLIARPSRLVSESPAVLCPDGKSDCPVAHSCCLTHHGTYTCCPENTPRCCRNVLCPDGKSECPEGNTCCLTANGVYGCCPKVNAVCCDDMIHCCPEGFKCDAGDGKCYNLSHPLLDLTSHATQVTSPPLRNVLCPDKKSECPDSNTCCLKEGATYGCCPKVNGVCCGDMIHCCPEGYKCDTADGKCSRDSLGRPFIRLVARPDSSVPSKVNSVFCPGSKQQCPDGNTCCGVRNETYMCCPEVSAVCCSDHKHCCPKGFTCANSQCLAVNSQHPLLQLTYTPSRFDPDEL